ncbi:glycoside hydrolase family 15 protein [Desulfococcus sp.]|uniref:glycoside hydrolase family 15 protein n=1 Tax=Desulfococcus sp. TaxID=2025834 RepID=UPI003592FCB4
MIIHNEQIRDLIKARYTPADIDRIRNLLDQHRVFHFPALPGGLFPAALTTPETRHTGYANVWVRDNVHVAHALWQTGCLQAAARTARALVAHFERQMARFDAVIADPASAADVMNRPHIRFDGAAECDLEETWPHAQNDALGYFLWLYSRLAQGGHVPVGDREAEVIARFPQYFAAIRYWEDEDSGHWEEVRRISASSIGTVVAGLRELKKLLTGPAPPAALRSMLPVGWVDALLAAGKTHLEAILPLECVQPDPRKKREYDAALLFLIHPLEVAEGAAAERILADITTHLQGDFGIKRYPGDSFWSADYWKNVKAWDRTGEVSGDTAPRDRCFIPGTEAQWCIFDPIVSAIYGRRYQRYRRIEDLDRQTFHMNRSLGQITGENARCGFGPDQIRIGPFKCPELYHVEIVESGKPEVQSSEAAPLLWTQANLLPALGMMARSLEKIPQD